MKLMLVGSLSFVKEISEIKKSLENKSHQVFLPPDAQLFLDDPSLTTKNHKEDYDRCIELDIFRKAFDIISNSDGILVINKSKNNINNYIGPATLMEMAVAYHLKKKIFTLNPFPRVNDLPSAHEMRIMQPIELNQDLNKIK